MSNPRTSIPKGLINALAEPYAFALVRWPAVIGLMTEPSLPWPDTTRVLVGIREIASLAHAQSDGLADDLVGVAEWDALAHEIVVVDERPSLWHYGL